MTPPRTNGARVRWQRLSCAVRGCGRRAVWPQSQSAKPRRKGKAHSCWSHRVQTGHASKECGPACGMRSHGVRIQCKECNLARSAGRWMHLRFCHDDFSLRQRLRSSSSECNACTGVYTTYVSPPIHIDETLLTSSTHCSYSFGQHPLNRAVLSSQRETAPRSAVLVLHAPLLF